MKRKKLILAVVLIVLILAYAILKLNDPREKTAKVFRINPEKVDTIEIWDKEQKISLKLQDKIWKLQEPVVWAADTLRVGRFFREVLSAEYPLTPMSESEDAISRYGLKDDEALHIRIGAGSRVVHVLFSNLGNAWDYFRFEGKNEVYQIKSKVVQHFNPEIINWRSAEILHYWEDEVKSIRSLHEGNDYTLTRDGTKWTYKDAKQSFEVPPDNFALVKIISLLQNFRSYVFISGKENPYLDSFQKPVVTVWITDTKGKTRKLSFAKFDNERHLLMLDDDETVLYEIQFDSIFRFMRNPEIFKRNMA